MKSDTQQNNPSNDGGKRNRNLNECLNNLKTVLDSSKLTENILQKCLLIE